MMGILQSMSQAVGTQPNKPKPLHLNTTTPALSPEKTMAANVANNLNTHGLLMKSAAARGERTAAARGLQHSTLGAEAAQRAMLDVAVPIAQVDTEHHHQQGLQRSQQDFTAAQAGLDRTHQLGMQRSQQDFTAAQAGLDRTHQLGMQRSQQDFTAAQAGLDRTHQLGMQRSQQDFTAAQAGLDRTHQLGMQRSQQDFTAAQAGLDRTHQSNLARLNTQLSHENSMKELNAQVAANTIGKSIDFTMQVYNNFDNQISAVQSNAKMAVSDKEKAINNLIKLRDSQLKFLESFMNAIPTRKLDWAAFPTLTYPKIKFPEKSNNP